MAVPFFMVPDVVVVVVVKVLFYKEQAREVIRGRWLGNLAKKWDTPILAFSMKLVCSEKRPQIPIVLVWRDAEIQMIVRISHKETGFWIC